MNNQLYFFGELVKLDYYHEVLIVCRSKCTAFPSGGSVWSYQLKDKDDKIICIDGHPWVLQSKLKKLHQPSRYSFYDLKQQMLTGYVDESDIL